MSYRAVLAITTAVLLAGTVLPGAANLAVAHETKKNSITVLHPWARATPPGAKTGVAYFEIAAGQEGGDKLIGAEAAGIAGRVEIHTHEKAGDVMRMRQIEALPVAAGSSVVLGPAGHHLMLMDLKRPLVEGDLVEITLRFEKAGLMPIEATIEPVGAKGPHGMDHQPGHEPGGHGGHASEHKH